MPQEDYLRFLAGDDPDARNVIGAAGLPILRLLHRISVSEPEQVSALLQECLRLFGPEASYHLAGILDAAMTNYDDRWMLAEVFARVTPGLSEEFGTMVEDWISDGDSEGPGRRPFGEVHTLSEYLRNAQRKIAFMENVVSGFVIGRVHDHAKIVVERFKGITEGIRMSGDDSPLADAWEEYKDQVHGEESMFFEVYVAQIRDIVDAYLEEVLPGEARLLWMATEGFLDLESDFRESWDPEDVVNLICAEVRGIADNEEIRYLGSPEDEEIEYEEEATWEKEE